MVVVGEIVSDEQGAVVATRGFYIDVTQSVEAEVQRAVSEELEVIVARRAVIEQAKGMLMATYNLQDAAAFDVLRWRSQELNIKLHDVAGEIVTKLPGLLNLGGQSRAAVNRLLMDGLG